MGHGDGTGQRMVIMTQALPRPHFRYTPVLRVGSQVFVSGMVALDPQHGQLIDGDAGAQTARILVNLQALMEEQGWSRSQLVLARIYCADFSAFGLVNQAWDAFFSAQDPLPARTSLGVQALPLGALVEIEFQFIVAEQTGALPRKEV